MIPKYSWESGYEHDWLGVDKSGHVGYFMSAYADMLPSHVSLPWPYLHNLYKMLIAHYTGCTSSCVQIKKGWSAYNEQIEFLTAIGLFVWDAAIDCSVGCFKRIGEPKNPIRVSEMHPFFRRIANNFVLSSGSFSCSSVISGKFQTGQSICCRNHVCGIDITKIDFVDLRPLLCRISRQEGFTERINLPDACAVKEAPSGIGPTFLCWKSARCLYARLIQVLAKELGVMKIEGIDFLGRRSAFALSEIEKKLLGMQLPFLSVALKSDKTRQITVSSDLHDVVGASSFLPSGYINKINSDMHIEDWGFDISFDVEKRSGARMFLPVIKKFAGLLVRKLNFSR